jgi:hypothetical protein
MSECVYTTNNRKMSKSISVLTTWRKQMKEWQVEYVGVA